MRFPLQVPLGPLTVWPGGGGRRAVTRIVVWRSRLPFRARHSPPQVGCSPAADSEENRIAAGHRGGPTLALYPAIPSPPKLSLSPPSSASQRSTDTPATAAHHPLPFLTTHPFSRATLRGPPHRVHRVLGDERRSGLLEDRQDVAGAERAPVVAHSPRGPAAVRAARLSDVGERGGAGEPRVEPVATGRWRCSSSLRVPWDRLPPASLSARHSGRGNSASRRPAPTRPPASRSCSAIPAAPVRCGKHRWRPQGSSRSRWRVRDDPSISGTA